MAQAASLAAAWHNALASTHLPRQLARGGAQTLLGALAPVHAGAHDRRQGLETAAASTSALAPPPPPAASTLTRKQAQRVKEILKTRTYLEAKTARHGPVHTPLHPLPPHACIHRGLRAAKASRLCSRRVPRCDRSHLRSAQSRHCRLAAVGNPRGAHEHAYTGGGVDQRPVSRAGGGTYSTSKRWRALAPMTCTYPLYRGCKSSWAGAVATRSCLLTPLLSGTRLRRWRQARSGAARATSRAAQRNCCLATSSAGP